MEKSVFTPEYAAMLGELRNSRRSAGISQEQLADLLGVGQSLISKWERGEARLDIVQLRTICHLLGTTLPAFVQKYEQRLAKKPTR